MGALRWIALAAILVYAVILLVVYLKQRDLQYFPSHEGLTPEAAGLSNVEIVQLATSDGETLVNWYAPAQAGKPTVLFFHGNGGEISSRSERFAALQAQGFGVFFLSYRGYGASTGSPSEQGFLTDARTAYEWLNGKGIAPEQIVLIGESLGSGVAVQIAAERKVAALALEAPFTSAADVAGGIYWYLPVSVLMKDQFRSADFIGKVNVPLLIIYGDADTIVPPEQSRRLHEMANEPKEIEALAGAGHDVIAEPIVWAREMDFFMKRRR
jgi:pimeloyl-ACP methyl ester carboxylesterase